MFWCSFINRAKIRQTYSNIIYKKKQYVKYKFLPYKIENGKSMSKNQQSDQGADKHVSLI